MSVDLETAILTSLQVTGVDQERSVVIAVSGGADSCALLLAGSHVLSAQTLIVAHYNHALRTPTEHNDERNHVQQIAHQLGLEFCSGSAHEGEVRRAADETGSGIEAAARSLRYRFLASVAAEAAAVTVLTAHTADDQAETVLMGLLRDVAPIGLAGIPFERPLTAATRVVRPMLAVSRAHAESYLQSLGVEWKSDSSNADPRHFRNNVRLNLLPALESLWPGIRGILRDLANDGQTIRRAAQLEAENLRWQPIESRDGRQVSLGAKNFFDATPSGRLVSFWQQAADTGLLRPDSRPPVRFFVPLLGERPKGRQVLLAGRGITVLQAGERLIWRDSVVRSEESGYFSLVELDRAICLPNGWELTLQRGEECDSPHIGSVVHLPGLQEPVMIRTPRPGDAIATPSGSKLVADLMSDLGIARDLRGSVPVIADRIGIVAVIGILGGAVNVVDMVGGTRDEKERNSLVVRQTR